MTIRFSLSTKLLCVILSSAILAVSLPLYGFSLEFDFELAHPFSSTNGTYLETSEGDSNRKEIVEIESRREKNVKHFQLEDGSVQAVVYGTDVHRKDAFGKWQDIDNRLFLNPENGYYETIDGVFSFSSDTSTNSLYALFDGQYKITVGLESDSVQESEAVITNHADRLQNSKQYTGPNKLEVLKRIDNTSTVTYRDVFHNVDLEYILSGNEIKENIVLKQFGVASEYVFSINIKGLEPSLCDDGSILLINDNGIEQYRISAPYMYDANGAASTDVHYSLEQRNDQYLLYIRADESWLTDSERTFPVIIDPTFEKTVLFDTYIYSGEPDTTHGSSSQLWVGTARYSYLRTSMPSIPDYAKITYASFNAYYYYYVTQGSLDIGLYRCMRNWVSSDLTWNIAAGWDNKGMATTRTALATATATSNINASNPALISFNVTSLVQGWYYGNTNKGIVLKRESGTNNSVILCSHEAATTYRPYFEISYVEITPILENGVYFLKNKQTSKFADIENQNIAEGTYIHQWDFHGGNTQKWIIKYTHKDNYYTIRTANYAPYHYLGVKNDSTASSARTVLRTGTDDNSIATIADGMLWGISTTASGAYKIRAITGEANDRVLSLGWYLLNVNGIDIDQCDYHEDNNYSDEWIFCMCTPDFTNVYIGTSDGDTTMQAILYAVNNQFNSHGYFGNSLNSATKSELIYMLKETDVFSTLTHGKQTSIRLTADGEFSISDVNSLDSSDIDQLIFVYLGACEVGKGGDSATNLVNAFYSKGVDVVVGFTDSVLVGESSFWTTIFMSNIANGQSIGVAISNADNSIQNDPILGGKTSYTTSFRLIRGSTTTIPCP